MHQKERYEEIITGKLAALPLPDMADAIWARIERQLDIDMPADEGGDVPEPSSPWGGGGGIVAGAGFLAFIGALLTFFYFQPTLKQNAAAPGPTPSQPPVNTNVIIDKPVAQLPTVPQIKKIMDTGTSVLFPTAPEISSSDVGLANPPPDSTAAIVQDETAQAASNSTLLPRLAEVKADSTPKKRRGVTGIGDKDYRIEPKKNEGP